MLMIKVAARFYPLGRFALSPPGRAIEAGFPMSLLAKEVGIGW